MHLHQVRQLQMYPQVQTSRHQPDPPDPRELHIQSERSDCLPLEKFSLQMPCISEFIRIFAPRTSCDVSRPFLLPLYSCIRSTLIGNEADVLLSCVLETGNFKNRTRLEFDSSRIYVGLSSYCLFAWHSRAQVQRRGIRWPTFRVYTRQYGASLQKYQHRIVPPVKAAQSGGNVYDMSRL